MKRKTLALLMAALLTLTSADGSAFLVSGAEFTSGDAEITVAEDGTTGAEAEAIQEEEVFSSEKAISSEEAFSSEEETFSSEEVTDVTDSEAEPATAEETEEVIDVTEFTSDEDETEAETEAKSAPETTDTSEITDVVEDELSGDDPFSDGTETEITNDGSTQITYTPETTGIYELESNVTYCSFEVTTADGTSLKLHYDGSGSAFVSLTKGTTYSISATADSLCPKLTVQIHPADTITAISAVAPTEQYYAGITSLKTPTCVVTLNGTQTKTMTFGGYVGGYQISFELTDETGEKLESDDYSSLSAGTWTITPKLCLHYADVETPEGCELTSAQFTVSELDLAALPALTLGQPRELKLSDGNRQYFTFTPTETGGYAWEATGEAYFYQKTDSGYSTSNAGGYDSDHTAYYYTLTGGVTYLVAVYLEDDATLVLSQKPAIELPKELSQLTLTEGMTKEVSLSTENTLECSFTPTEDGYYTFASSEISGLRNGDPDVILYENDEWQSEDEYGAGYPNFSLTYYLSKGTTYSYKVVNSSSKTGSFSLTLNKAKVQPITNVSLITSGNTTDIFDYWQGNLDVQITYEDGTTETIDLPDYNKKVSYGNTLEASIELAEGADPLADEEVEFVITFTASSVMTNVKDKTFIDPYTVKGINSLEKLTAGQSTAAAEIDDFYDYKVFEPVESGEYLLTLTPYASCASISIYTELYYEDSSNRVAAQNYVSTQSAGSQACSVYLEEGKTYYINAFMEGDGTLTIKKVTKTLTGLKLVKLPTDPCCLYSPVFGTLVHYAGLQAEASYTDGTTELVTFGTPDSTGKSLQIVSMTWISDDICRVGIALGGYKFYYNAQKTSLESAASSFLLDETETYTGGNESEWIFGKFTPAESADYKLNITGGYIYCVTDAQENRLKVTDNQIHLEQGQTYFLFLKFNQSDLSFTITSEQLKKEAVQVAKPTAANFTYNGTTRTGVTARDGYTLTGTVSAAAAGTYQVTATLLEGYAWADGTTAPLTLSWRIDKAAQTVSAKVRSKTYKTASLKKKAASFTIGASGQGTLTYKVVKTPTGASKYVKVDKKGKVTVAKNAKTGTYTIRVTAAGNGNYKAATRDITLKVNGQTQKIKTKVSSRSYKRSVVRKKAQTFTIGASGYGKITYKVSSTPSGASKYLKVTSKGTVTLKKNAKAGTYKILVSAAGDSKYNPATKTITIKVK